ncbi:phenylacetone monooxygenase [Mytilinidion resinicola]|uniref:Phenylacetone monooxygenase n=1 Tax=Mytilinidion resinicola TaxID=574789 RepID=A0A6A6Z407_9PEZI|nr:phenylacetone monooxygenase [Mytilinidion resinicola]KAF2815548.1 phenylacetone monooxygenase [Mytilinidion resinicola]
MAPSLEVEDLGAPATKPTSAVKALDDKYREERDKRLNNSGSSQFREAKGELARFAIDPWTEEIVRDSVNEDVEVLIVGGGFGGLLAATRLIEVGVDDIRIVDKAGDFGGVWYWNRYPGVECDTEAYIYLPLLEETKYVPAAKFAPGAEIHAHALNIAKMNNLQSKAHFRTEALTLTWSDSLARWVATTSRGDTIRARFVISAIGILHKLHLPGIQGIEKFAGHSFHSSRWDFAYTGGDRFNSPLDKIRGKRIGIVGTGASSIQALPHLARSGAEVYVFQRTPSSVDAKPNPPTDRTWFESLKPGWQDHRADNFERILSGQPQDIDLVNDGWTHFMLSMEALGKDSSTPKDDILKKVDIKAMESLRSRVEEIVKDKETAEALKPWYGRLCKRPCFHNEYLDCFNYPNVHLIHTDGKGVDRISEKGVVSNGKEYELDCIIYATGFDWGTDYSQRANMTIKGRNGLTLTEKWEDGPSTLHGIIGRDFPNLLTFTHLQSSTSPNYTHLLSERSKHAAYLISEAKKRGIRTIEPTKDAEATWVKKMEDVALARLGYFKECTPGYLNAEGTLSPSTARGASLGLDSPVYNEMLDKWRKAGTMEGIEIDRV